MDRAFMAFPQASVESPGAGAVKPTGRSVAAYLAILALAALLPSIAFSAILLQRHNQAQQDVVETLVVGTSRSALQAVEREIAAKITTLRVLATSPSLLSGNLRSFHARTRAALAGSGAHMFLLDDNFETVLNTRTEFGTPPMRTADVASARQALETGDVVVSDGLLGPVSRRWVYNILLPIQPAPAGARVLVLNQVADELSAVLAGNRLPDGWSAALVDGKGAVLAATSGAGSAGERFGLLDTATFPHTDGWTALGSGSEELRVVVHHSGLSGWSLVTWAPLATITKPLSDVMAALILGGVLLAGLMLLAIYWTALRIGRSVRGLARDAEALGAGEAVPARAYPVAEIATVSAALSQAAAQRSAAEAEVRFLMRELAHRSKNQMTVIMAMAKQTAATAKTLPQFVLSFEHRIFGLARSTDLLLAHGMAGIDLRELLASQIEPFGPREGDRVQLSGPALRLDAQAAQVLGMAAHELSTNAVKYGAFSREDGRLEVHWSRGDDQVHLVWRERVAGLRRRSPRRGFGTTVIQSMVARALHAGVERILHRDGIEWRFTIPGSVFAEPASDAAPPEPGSIPAAVPPPERAEAAALPA